MSGFKSSGENTTVGIQAFKELKGVIANYFPQIFKTVTLNNDSEFANLSESLNQTTEVYFTPHILPEQEEQAKNHNKIIRRFIPKRCDITHLNKRMNQTTQDLMNHYPRKTLHGASPLETFLEELADTGVGLDIAV